MDHRTKTLVQESLALVTPITDDAARLFYGRLFELDPSLRSMFPDDLSDQGRKLMQMLSATVKGLNRIEKTDTSTRATRRAARRLGRQDRTLRDGWLRLDLDLGAGSRGCVYSRCPVSVDKNVCARVGGDD